MEDGDALFLTNISNLNGHNSHLQAKAKVPDWQISIGGRVGIGQKSPTPLFLSSMVLCFATISKDTQLDQGNLVIVPNLPTNLNSDEVPRWYQITPKEYKTRRDIQAHFLSNRTTTLP